MLRVEKLSLGYDGNRIVREISFDIETEGITTIIGPNGCGKSTILKALSKNKKPISGDIFFEEIDLKAYKAKELARKMSILPQSPKAPEDVNVRDLVGYGRYPHLSWTGRLTKNDYEVIDWAISETKLEGLQHRHVSTLSGGERQRAWVAMALAQQSKILLLDEPTTFLDICHQYELLELVKKLNKQMGITIVMVLHDLNQAARYSHKIIVVKDGEKYQEGKPYEIITNKVLADVFNMEGKVLQDEDNNCPYFIPIHSRTGVGFNGTEDIETPLKTIPGSA